MGGACIWNDPCALFAPDELDFRTIDASCAARRTFRLYSLCPNSTLTSVALTDGGVFRWSKMPVMPSSTSPLEGEIEFAPSGTSGSFSDTVVVNAVINGSSVTHSMRVRGSADSTGVSADEFVVRTRADLFMVLDLSCSIQPAVDFVRDRSSSLLAFPRSTGVSFHLGAAEDQSRTLFGPPGANFMTSASPNEAFKAYVPDGGTGSDVENMTRSILALVPPDQVTQNAGFLRRDALLSVLFLSDSVAPDSTTALDVLRSIKGYRNVNDVVVSSIANTATSPSSCPYAGLGFAADYAMMASATGGVAADVCLLDPPMLTALGQNLFGGEQHRFRVLGEPSGALPTVYVNGALIPRTTANNVAIWDWNSEGVLTFQQGYWPTAGDVIRIEYQTACGP